MGFVGQPGEEAEGHHGDGEDEGNDGKDGGEGVAGFLFVVVSDALDGGSTLEGEAGPLAAPSGTVALGRVFGAPGAVGAGVVGRPGFLRGPVFRAMVGAPVPAAEGPVLRGMVGAGRGAPGLAGAPPDLSWMVGAGRGGVLPTGGLGASAAGGGSGDGGGGRIGFQSDPDGFLFDRNRGGFGGHAFRRHRGPGGRSRRGRGLRWGGGLGRGRRLVVGVAHEVISVRREVRGC